jgi:hypothetical protein
MHPFHRIGSFEGNTPGQHFVKCDAKRVEVAPGIDGTIHSSGLLGCHIRECPGDELASFSSLALTGKPRGDTKSPQPALAGDGVYQNIRRLDVFVDNSTLMQLTDCLGKANCETQEKPQVQRLTEQLI